MKPEQPHYHGHRKRLREKFIKNGFEGFADYEIVELLLTLAIPIYDVKEPAKILIEKFGSLKNIIDAPIEELQKLKGIGSVTPVAFRIIREAVTLYLQQSAEEHDSFIDPQALYLFWRMKIGSLSNEVFQLGYLDSGYRLLRDGIETLEIGIPDRASVYPRQVIESALRRNAAVIVMAHNHPTAMFFPPSRTRFLPGQ
ncbi:MAG: hypothetical protein NT030_08175 [Candidatus Saganbacteria bacterium]|nr:hypothetical protein [Candidatus Saganbacteria bacterium]